MSGSVLVSDQLKGGEAQFELVDNEGGEIFQDGELSVGDLVVGLAVQDGEGSEAVSVGGDERGCGIEPDLFVAGDQRVFAGAGVNGGVGDQVWAVPGDDGDAQAGLGTELRPIQ